MGYICRTILEKNYMKFIVSSSQLLKQLQVLGGVINSNNTLPILDNFLFEISSEGMGAKVHVREGKNPC